MESRLELRASKTDHDRRQTELAAKEKRLNQASLDMSEFLESQRQATARLEARIEQTEGNNRELKSRWEEALSEVQALKRTVGTVTRKGMCRGSRPREGVNREGQEKRWRN